jgi:hypothetical protein
VYGQLRQIEVVIEIVFHMVNTFLSSQLVKYRPEYFSDHLSFCSPAELADRIISSCLTTADSKTRTLAPATLEDRKRLFSDFQLLIIKWVTQEGLVHGRCPFQYVTERKVVTVAGSCFCPDTDCTRSQSGRRRRVTDSSDSGMSRKGEPP